VLLDFDRAIASGKRMGDTIDQVAAVVDVLVDVLVDVVVDVDVVVVVVVVISTIRTTNTLRWLCSPLFSWLPNNASLQTFVRSRKRQNSTSKMGMGMATGAALRTLPSLHYCNIWPQAQHLTRAVTWTKELSVSKRDRSIQ
jgi:hypothetical protein